MERNENGLPRTQGNNGRVAGNTTQNGMQNGFGSNGSMNGNNYVGGTRGGCRGEGASGGDDSMNGGGLDGMPLAYVYAPSQKFRLLYSPADALAHGTLFEELYKPMEVYGRE